MTNFSSKIVIFDKKKTNFWREDLKRDFFNDCQTQGHDDKCLDQMDYEKSFITIKSADFDALWQVLKLIKVLGVQCSGDSQLFRFLWFQDNKLKNMSVWKIYSTQLFAHIHTGAKLNFLSKNWLFKKLLIFAIFMAKSWILGAKIQIFVKKLS